MWWQPTWSFIQRYWQILALALFSLILAVPMAQELKYKYHQTFFTRLAQLMLVFLFACVILAFFLGLTHFL